MVKLNYLNTKKIWFDPLTWWKSTIQNSINIFKEKALNIDKNGVMIWSEFLKRIHN